MRQQFTASPGTSLTSISLSNATYITGVQVDNPSGGWLYIVESKDFVPPYTSGWYRDLPFQATSLTVLWGQSPSGQVSTVAGDPYLITLDSESVGSSNTPDKSIFDFTQSFLLQTSVTITPGTPGVTANNNVVVASKRLRITQMILSGLPNVTYCPNRLGMLVRIVFDNNSGGQSTALHQLSIGGHKTHDELLLSPYINTSTASGTNLSINLQWSNVQLDPTGWGTPATWSANGLVLYQVI